MLHAMAQSLPPTPPPTPAAGVQAHVQQQARYAAAGALANVLQHGSLQSVWTTEPDRLSYLVAFGKLRQGEGPASPPTSGILRSSYILHGEGPAKARLASAAPFASAPLLLLRSSWLSGDSI